MADSAISVLTPPGGATVEQVRTDKNGLYHWQYMKPAFGAPGTADPVTQVNPLPAGVKLWDGAAWVTARSNPPALSPGDGLQGVIPMLVNAAGTYDPEQAKQDANLLASLERTANASSPIISSPSARALMLNIDITVNAGSTAKVRPYIIGYMGVSSTYLWRTAADIPAWASTVGRYSYLIHPDVGASNVDPPVSTYVSYAVPLPLPRRWSVSVVHNDAAPITYSLNYALLN